MHIGINLLYLRPGKVGGSEVYVRNLVAQLGAREAIALTLLCSQEAAGTFAESDNVRVVVAADGPYGHLRRLRAENVGLAAQLREHPVDVLFSPANFAAPALPVRVPQVVTVHDLQHHWLPEHFSLATRLQRTAMFAASFARARHIIAISEFTRRDVMRRYRVRGRRITRILEGVRETVPGSAETATATARRHGIARPFFFYPAADHAHKNHRRLLQAFARFRERTGLDVELVLCGAQGEVWYHAARRASSFGLDGHVRHLGFVARRDDVFDLMRAASALVFPSEFEGFGLPPVEAQKVGTPVLASNRASIPEIVGEGALLLDPLDIEAWARGMGRVVRDDDLRARLVAAGHANVGRFSWARCADQTAAVLRRAAGR